MKLEEVKIGVIGLGYVGLPLAVEFAKKFPVLGFDINPQRVGELKEGVDRTREVESEELKKVLGRRGEKGLEVTSDPARLEWCNFYIVTVPTPVDQHKTPDLRPLKMASETVGKYLKAGDIVVYESTVFPGCTEEVCVPILERESGLKFNKEFFVGYSPERINPGDKKHRLPNIVKVTSGSTPEVAKLVDRVYREIITAGTHLAPSIKVAEAAKVIENSQRDINIAFINELSLIFDKLGIDTLEVLEAAGTKWNFLPFRPGLVGGHCIGVDPYYLTYKAQEVNHHPEVILAGRRVNDYMGIEVANRVIKLLIKKGHIIRGSRVLVMGITFKENCPDIRNSRVIDVIRELKEFGVEVEVYDPVADPEEVKKEYGLSLVSAPQLEGYDGIVVAVAHEQFKEMESEIAKLPEDRVIFDVKGIYPKRLVDGRL
jgi:UDP-N-acetyl-D-galactosamine dehydrogenase